MWNFYVKAFLFGAFISIINAETDEIQEALNVRRTFSDDVCIVRENKIIKNSTEDEHFSSAGISHDGEVNRSSYDENDYKDRPRPDQKSLLIVFDATESMKDALDELQEAARHIIKDFSSREINPIFNYVLEIFRDPEIEAPFITRDPNDILTKLKMIRTYGGGRCPEMCLSGISKAINLALPKSIVYVFTDATARDHYLYEEVAKVVQSKQLSLYFILTGNCNDYTHSTPGYKVYEKLSKLSHKGQVHNINKGNIRKILLEINKQADEDIVSVASINAPSGIKTEAEVKIDSSFSGINLAVTGTNPSLIVTDHNNDVVEFSSMLSLNNSLIINIDKPNDSIYNVAANANSSYNIRISGKSELSFEFGFSTIIPNRITETSLNPLNGEKNILTIFIKDPHFINYLTNVTILPNIRTRKFKVPLTQITPKQYSTDPFDIPNGIFQILLNGRDSECNQIERLISSGIEASKGTAPEIRVEVNKKVIDEFDRLLLQCIVKSLTPVNITLSIENNLLKEKSSSQSDVVDYEIAKVSSVHSGNYSCKTINEIGTTIELIEVKVVNEPNVTVIPEKGKINENQTIRFRCNVEGATGDYNVTWLNDDGVSLESSNIEYEFVATHKNHSKQLTCRVRNRGFIIQKHANIFVDFAPKFKQQLNESSKILKLTYGDDAELDCESDGNPNGGITWTFVEKSGETNELAEKRKILNLTNASQEGAYECKVQNYLGEISRGFDVSLIAQVPPKIRIERQILTVNETSTVNLSCECIGCVPIRKFYWTHKASRRYHAISDVEYNRFQSILVINDAEESDSGDIECYLMNELGEAKAQIQLQVQTKPRIESIKMIIDGGTEIDVSDNIIIMENRSITIKCNVGGFPITSVLWFKNNEHINNNDTTLKFDTIQDLDAGRYICEAQTLLGKASKQFTLDVNFAPKVRNEEIKIFVYKREKELILLNCSIYGFPEPSLVWYSNSTTLSSDATYRISDDKRYMEFEYRNVNSGSYLCNAKNDFGENSIEFIVDVLVSPKILNPDGEIHKKLVGDELSLSCDASGKPQPSVMWTKKDIVIGSGKHFNISKLALENSGNYHCNVSSEAGATSKIFSITVNEKPQIISQFENLTFINDGREEIECFAKGTPFPNVYWMLDKNIVGDVNKLVLNISSASGFYKCFANSSEGSDEISFYFNAVIRPMKISDFNIEESYVEIKEGSNAELVCPYENFDNISWTFNDQLLENVSVKHRANKILINNISNSSTGKWFCEVTNLAGNGVFTINVEVLMIPRIIDKKLNQNFIRNVTETLELLCNANGYPDPEIYWIRGTRNESLEDVLFIANIQINDAGIYTCIAGNSQGNDEMHVELEVAASPFIVNGSRESTYSLSVGERAQLDCYLNGSPAPKISWFKEKNSVNYTGNSLVLEQVKSSDYGFYKCIGTNKWGSEEKNFHINILGPAEVVEIKKVYGDRIILSCKVRGNPLPRVTWIKNGKIISTSSQLNLNNLFMGMQSKYIHFTDHGRGFKFLDETKLLMNEDGIYSKLMMTSFNTIQLDITFTTNEESKGKYECFTMNQKGIDETFVIV